MSSEVVFIGGAIAPLLQLDPPFDEARPTKDVDGVIASAKYTDMEMMHRRLAEKGFKQPIAKSAHVHRWYSPSGDAFDLVPAGEHLGGSGQDWDRIALETSVVLKHEEGFIVRHASAPAFLALKWAAHNDRGMDNPFASHDLEDVVALLASRESIVEELDQSPIELKTFVVEQLQKLLSRMDLQDILASHLNNADDPAEAINSTKDTMNQIASLAP